MEKRKLLFLLFLPFVVAEGLAQNAFTLREAIDYALVNNPSYLNSQLDAQVSVARKNEVRGIGLPQISGSFDLKDYVEIPTSLIPGEFFGAPPGTFIPVQFGTQYNATAGIQVSQLIFSSDYLVALQASEAFLQLTEKNVQRSKIDIIVNISKAYYNVLVNRERLSLIDANVKRLEKLLNDTRLLHANGFVEKIDVDRVEVAYNNLQAEKEKIGRLVGLTEILLKFQMGMDVTQPVTLKDSLDMTSIPAPAIKDETSADIKNRIEYSLLQSQKRLSVLEMKRDRLSFLPSLIAYGSLNANAQRTEFDIFDTQLRWFPVAVIGATLNVPIFAGGQKYYKLQQSKLNLLILDNNIRSLENSLRMEVSSSAIAYQNAWTSLEAQKKNMELARNIVEVVKKKFEQGVGSNLELIDAETSLREALTNYFNALYEYYMAQIDYEKAHGQIK